MSLVLHLLSGDAERLAEPNPELDPTGARRQAIVVHDPLHPGATDLRLGTVGDDGRVFPGNGALVGQPIRHPPLEPPCRQPALVHELVKGMVCVIGRTERSHRIRQGIRRKRLMELGKRWSRRRRQRGGAQGDGHVQMLKLMPSDPTLRPRCSTSALSEESSSRMGLVLLMWV